jgi:Arc/MetJ-type ribon-helix-helix transcriptional regulator
MSLSPETQKLIEGRMKAGGFPSPDDVVQAALASLDQQDPLSRIADAELDALYPGFREKIARGLAEAEAGRVSDGEEFFAELEREEAEFEERQGRKTA